MKNPTPTDEQKNDAMTQDGVGTPKKDVTAPKEGEVNTPEAREGRTSAKQEEKRAKDAHPAGLSASEMVRFEFLSRKPDINEDETKELQALGYKREHGLPEAQHKEVMETAVNGNRAKATNESIKRESSQGRAEELERAEKEDHADPYEKA